MYMSRLKAKDKDWVGKNRSPGPYLDPKTLHPGPVLRFSGPGVKLKHQGPFIVIINKLLSTNAIYAYKFNGIQVVHITFKLLLVSLCEKSWIIGSI